MTLPNFAREKFVNDLVIGLQILTTTDNTFQHCVQHVCISFFKPESVECLLENSAFVSAL